MFSYYTLSQDNELKGTHDWAKVTKSPIGTVLYNHYDGSFHYCHKHNPSGRFAVWERAHTRDIIRMKAALLIEGVPV